MSLVVHNELQDINSLKSQVVHNEVQDIIYYKSLAVYNELQSELFITSQKSKRTTQEKMDGGISNTAKKNDVTICQVTSHVLDWTPMIKRQTTCDM